MTYINEGQKPFVSIGEPATDKKARERARNANKKYYKLGMPKVKKLKRCKKCGRPIVQGNDHVCGNSKIMAKQIECPKCKTMILADATVCYSCKNWVQP